MMSKNRILGTIAAVVAVAILVLGVLGASLARNTLEGTQSPRVSQAQALYETVSAYQKAAEKTAPATVKKAATAQKAVQQAKVDTQKAMEEMQELTAALSAQESCGDATVDSMIQALASAQTVDPQVQTLLDDMILALYADLANDSLSSLQDAEKKIVSAQESIADVLTATGTVYESPITQPTDALSCADVDGCLLAAQAYIDAAEALSATADSVVQQADEALAQAKTAYSAKTIDFLSRCIVFVQINWIGFLFTAFLLLVVAAVTFFAAETFLRSWKNMPVFSTAIALLVMVAIQTYALGFRFPSVTAWLAYWYNNAMNVLRANSSIGMIALGMTFVIISGGIDLAVGSTLAGVSTVIMCLIDVGPKGLLSNMGITGLASYAIACGVGIVVGLLFGTLTGTVITKGKVPPFIVTLGTMQIIRSVAQYFTKSYNPEVPKEFQVLANASIGGQMLLPIVYWLFLAFLFYIVSRHTTFGRHVYAIGSNERTTMLSGINVDRVKMKVYILMGFIVALASIVQVARLRGVDVASAGSGYEMNAIAAVVVGGTSMSGGKGSIIGTVLGVLIIGIMNNLLVLLSVDSFLSSAFTGAIVIAAVLMQRKEKAA